MTERSRCRTSALGRERPFEARVHLALAVRLSTNEYHSTLRLGLTGHHNFRFRRSDHPLTDGGATISPSRSNTRIASCAARTFDSARIWI